MDSYQDLIEGYKVFRHKYLQQDFNDYRSWAATTQKPKVMIIGCSDSRVNPAILTHAGLGDIFATNNVANIVPPYEAGQHSHLSIGAAVQFAVTNLEVEHIIVMAHSGCGGVRALMSRSGDDGDERPEDDYIQGWVNVIKEARDAVKSTMGDRDFEEQCQICEMEGALVSLANLTGYPYVRRALEKGNLDLHAWYFHIETGELLSYNHEKGQYRRLVRLQ